MTSKKLTAREIEKMIISSFEDAKDYFNFMQSADNNASNWQRINHVEIESKSAYNEAIAVIQKSFKDTACLRMQDDIKGLEFDPEDVFLLLFRRASEEEISAMAGLSYDEAREIIKAKGTLFSFS